MKLISNICLTSIFLLLWACNNQPISLHPENPNYFLYQGKPTVLITSGEHYGAVMNLDFDYKKYLTTLNREGLNYTRIFLGPYSEIGADLFGIKNNTMNPKPEKWITPWKKDSVTGKFDLEQWNEPFFQRLKSFIAEADQNGIVVEVTLFTSYYGDHQWSRSPFNPKNNVLGFDSINFRQVNTPENGKIMEVQENYVRRIVKELNGFGNIIYEIQNEPWADNTIRVETIADKDSLHHPFAWPKVVDVANENSMNWQKKIAAIIADEESKLPGKHLIAQNYSNFMLKVTNPDPNVSIINFHYAFPEAASTNLGLKRVIALDETGFMPHGDFNYRSQAWKFMLAGGAVYNNLDYSFTVGNEDGKYTIDEGTPGWGGPAFRQQLSVLKSFIESFSFIRMAPANDILTVREGSLGAFQVLSEPGQQYAIYLERGKSPQMEISVPDGSYAAVWINIRSGKEERSEDIQSANGKLTLQFKGDFEDIALKLKPHKK